MPKFQAIQYANEVLGDAMSKQKYDTDRRKAGLYPTGPTFNPRQAAPGNPYAASSQFPPPPRRTQPGGYQRQPPPPQPNPFAAAGPPPSGADRFHNFTRAAPTARKDPAAQSRTDTFKAWQNLNNTQDRQQAFSPQPSRAHPHPQPQPPPSHARQRPPPPPRQETTMPTEEQIRAGMKHRNGPRLDSENLERNQSAWQAFNKQPNAPKPGVARTSSMRTPNRQGGFNPNMPGSDERPAGSHHMHRNKSADFGSPQPGAKMPPPPAPPPPGTNPSTPQSPLSPNYRRPFAEPTKPSHIRMPDDQVPYFEGTRNRTPYSSNLHEKIDLADGLKRSHSVRDTTKLGPDDAANRDRARSTSPLGRQRDNNNNTNGSSRKEPFMVYSDSDDSGSDVTQTPEDADSSSPTTDEQRPDMAPNTRPPFNRPKIIPTPPSRSRRPSSRPPTANATQSDTEQPDMQQKSNSNMYDKPISFSTLPPQVPHGQVSNSHSTSRARRTWSSVGRWAIPSSVNPSASRVKSTIIKSDRKPQQGSFVTAADPLFVKARLDERNAYLRFQSDLRSVYQQTPNNLDMKVFLSLASTARKGLSCGETRLDTLLQRLLQDFPIVGTAQNNPADNIFRDSSFTYNPHNNGAYSATNGKSKSEENINTNFSPEPWNGSFSGSEYFPQPDSTGGKKPSSSRQSTRTPGEQPRSATMDLPPMDTPVEEVPSRPWGSDGTPKAVPTHTAPVGGPFEGDRWQNQTFFTAEELPRQSSPVKGGFATSARKPAQGRKASRVAASAGAQQTPAPHAVGADAEAGAGGMDGGLESGAQFVADPMDIDEPPTANRSTGHAHESATQATDKSARLISVPPSTWRQDQQQKMGQTSTHHKTSSASRRAECASTSDGAKLNTTLDDLRHVEPIARSAPGGTGLNDFGDLSSTLPFKSEAARNIPQSTPSIQQFELPTVPTHPPEPVRASKANWQNYARFFGEYCKAFHNFDRTMLQYFDSAEKRTASRFANGTSWLEATGDTSGMFGESTGFGSYAADSLLMERARTHWNVGCDRYRDGMKMFEKAREGIRKKAAEGTLPEV